MSAYRWPRAQPSPEEAEVYTGTVYGPDPWEDADGFVVLGHTCYDPVLMEYSPDPCGACTREGRS